MSVRLVWDNAQRTILRVDFQGPWGTREMEDVRNTGISMLESTLSCVAIIMNMQQSNFVPGDLISHAGMIVVRNCYEQRTMPQVCLQVVVGANRVIKGLFHAFIKVYPWTVLAERMTFADTLEEARTMIAKRCGIELAL